jgi:methyltransferase (TIGR00027 family)
MTLSPPLPPGRPSFTAETMALQRAFESRRPPGRRLFEDPYAEAFLRPALRVLATASGVALLRHLATGLYDVIGGRGPRPSAIVRTKVIDDAVDGAARQHDQVVLLGAGYDTRAHRLSSLAGHDVFEVDHPATQATKRATVAALALPTDRVVYVPVDFEQDDLMGCLLRAGFDPERPALFLWEGVTQYLTSEAVDATLSVIAALGKHGGVLVVTYVDAGALSVPSPFPEARRWVRAVARAGEPWIFGLRPRQADRFFAERGFRLRRDVSTFDASHDDSVMGGRRLNGSALYRVAVVDVATSGGTLPPAM